MIAEICSMWVALATAIITRTGSLPGAKIRRRSKLFVGQDTGIGEFDYLTDC
jgi:hypothetical protein